jgi:hypothetical protein
MHACIHADIHRDRQTDRQIYRQTDRHELIVVSKTDKQKNIHTHILTYMHTCIYTYVHAYVHTCIHTYIHIQGINTAVETSKSKGHLPENFILAADDLLPLLIYVVVQVHAYILCSASMRLRSVYIVQVCAYDLYI